MLTSVDVSATHFDVSSQFVDASFKRFKLEICSYLIICPFLWLLLLLMSYTSWRICAGVRLHGGVCKARALVSLRNTSCSPCCQVPQHQQKLLVCSALHYHIQSHSDSGLAERCRISPQETRQTKYSKYEFVYSLSIGVDQETALGRGRGLKHAENIMFSFSPLMKNNEPDGVRQSHFQQFLTRLMFFFSFNGPKEQYNASPWRYNKSSSVSRGGDSFFFLFFFSRTWINLLHFFDWFNVWII